MSRPPLEVADLIRSAGAAFIERNRQWLSWKHIKVLLAIARCRTAALGGHLDQCTRCGHRATISYNSCRNRHCPKCQTAARERWIAARQRELLPTHYVHVVFTLPPQLAPLALQNKCEDRLEGHAETSRRASFSDLQPAACLLYAAKLGCTGRRDSTGHASREPGDKARLSIGLSRASALSDGKSKSAGVWRERPGELRRLAMTPT